jgi:hypothetical protein
MRKQRFNVTLEPEQVQFLRLLEKVTGSSASEQIRRAIETYIRAEAKTLGPYVRAEIEKRRKAAIRAKLKG